jgi:hypothetical protein
MRYRQYDTWEKLTESKSLEPDLQAAINLVNRFKNNTPHVVQSIVAARVSHILVHTLWLLW